jgi:cytochrome P450
LDEFLGGTNLLTGHTDAHWKAVRKGVAPAFSAGCMKGAFANVRERCAAMTGILNALGPARALNVDDLLLRESMDVIGRVGFQKEMGALAALQAAVSGTGADDKGSYVRTMLECTHEVERRMAEPHRDKKYWKAAVRAGHALMTRWRTIVKSELLQHIKDVTPVKGSFADLLLKVKDPATNAPLTDAKLLPEITALFFAGTDTTGHTGTWTLYLLSQHPAVEAKVLAELRAAGLAAPEGAPEGTPPPRQMEYSDLGKLVYLQAVIKEVLRLFPPVAAGQVRVAAQDLSLAGGRVFVPAGSMLWVPHHAIQNAVHNWDEPEAFKPERWLAGGAEFADRLTMPKDWYEGWTDGLDLDGSSSGASASSADPDSDLAGELGGADRPKRYFPFAEGLRNCVGQSLAKVSLVTTMATLLPRFRFVLADSMGGAKGVRSRELYSLVLGIEGGMHMRAVPRGTPEAALPADAVAEADAFWAAQARGGGGGGVPAAPVVVAEE